MHKKLKIRAAEEGITLSEYLLREAERVASRPTLAELTERVRKRRPHSRGPRYPLIVLAASASNAASPASGPAKSSDGYDGSPSRPQP